MVGFASLDFVDEGFLALDFGGGFGFDFSSALAFEDRVALDRCSAMQLSGRRSGLGR